MFHESSWRALNYWSLSVGCYSQRFCNQPPLLGSVLFRVSQYFNISSVWYSQTMASLSPSLSQQLLEEWFWTGSCGEVRYRPYKFPLMQKSDFYLPANLLTWCLFDAFLMTVWYLFVLCTVFDMRNILLKHLHCILYISVRVQLALSCRKIKTTKELYTLTLVGKP